MTVISSIPDTLVQESIIRAVKNVCTKMLKRDAAFVEKGTPGTQNAPGAGPRGVEVVWVQTTLTATGCPEP